VVKKTQTRKIMGVESPKETCEDSKCPFHGDIIPRGRTFVATVESSKMTRTAKVVWDRRNYIPKYERYEKRRSKVFAHNPPCIKAVEGDVVKIMETRPLSKGKNFVIIQKVKETGKAIKKVQEEEKETKK